MSGASKVYRYVRTKKILWKNEHLLQPRLNKMVLLCLEAYNSGLEAGIVTCRDTPAIPCARQQTLFCGEM